VTFATLESCRVDAWLTTARDELATLAEIPKTELVLDADDEQTILELARIAAHESGERINAPLLCYLAGRAAERGSVAPERLLAAVRRVV
jgi:Domain of unknown function (DUF6457)